MKSYISPVAVGVLLGLASSAGAQNWPNIKMQPLISVLIFMSVWLDIVGIVCLWMIITAFIHIREIGQIFEGGFSPIIFVPFVMFIVGSLFTYFGFKFESKKSKEFLADLLEGEEVPA